MLNARRGSGASAQLARQSSEHERAARLRAEREREAVRVEVAAVDGELQHTLSTIAALEAAGAVPAAVCGGFWWRQQQRAEQEEQQQQEEKEEAAAAERRVAAVHAFVLAKFGAEDFDGHPSWVTGHWDQCCTQWSSGLWINLRGLDSGDAKCIALCDLLPRIKHTLTRLTFDANELTDKFGPALIAVLPQLTKLKDLSINDSSRSLSDKVLVAIGVAAPSSCSVWCYRPDVHAALQRLRPAEEAEPEPDAGYVGWDAYVDNMKATGQCEDGCIIGLDGTPWTGGLAITKAEACAIIDHFGKFGEPIDSTRVRRIPGTEECGYPYRDAEGRLQYQAEEDGPPMLAAVTGLSAGGIVVAGRKFMYLRNDKEMMVGRAGQCGICIFMCGQCMIMGTYNQDMASAMNTKEVGKMAVRVPTCPDVRSILPPTCWGCCVFVSSCSSVCRSF
jgi:hypothetical protein